MSSRVKCELLPLLDFKPWLNNSTLAILTTAEFKKKMKFDHTMFVDISEAEDENGARVYNIVSRNDIEV